jgi:penicillin-insensitive murein endopeptidase
MNQQSFLIAALILTFAPLAFGNPWSGVSEPSQGPPRAIGETNAGCQSGAQELPTEGEGYVVMHLERNRYYGQPSLIDAITNLGEQAADGLGVLHVGDLSLPRGGPMPFGHRSHQTGLDVDVWFDLNPRLHRGANSSRSNVSARSLLISASRGLDYNLWNDGHVQILKAAAQLPGVDRIFVNAHIKGELCDSVARDRGWLRKIRPWFHHDDHFHMRLTCPPNSPDCVRQDPIPPGDGCDSSLDWWFGHPPSTSTAKPPEPKPRLPSACLGLLDE